MFYLPQVPKPVNHAMMRPEDGIPGRCPDTTHVAADRSIVSARPAVNVVVNIFNLSLEIIELREVEQCIYGRRGWKYGRICREATRHPVDRRVGRWSDDARAKKRVGLTIHSRC